MIQQNTPYGLSTTIASDFTTAVSRARAALAAEGFGVLAEMNIAAAMRDKLHVPFRDYVILGACMPALAHQAILAETDIGLLLPCNVIVYATDDHNRTVIAALDPVAVLSLADNDAIRPLAEQVKQRLRRVLEAVDQS
jgi:uncharacterized protein (DUF302 family)